MSSDLNLTAFDSEMRSIVSEYLEMGWSGRMSSKNHAILRAPDGVATEVVPRSSLRGRSDKNARARLERWKREQAPEPEPEPEPLPSPEPKPVHLCQDCGWSGSSEKSLQAHRRKHVLVYSACVICDRQVTYMDKHLRAHRRELEQAAGTGATSSRLIEQVNLLESERAEWQELAETYAAQLDAIREVLAR